MTSWTSSTPRPCRKRRRYCASTKGVAHPFFRADALTQTSTARVLIADPARRKVSKLMDSKYKREPVILPTIIPTSSGPLLADDEEVEASRESL